MELISKYELINKINAYMITTPDVTMVHKLINEVPVINIVKCKDCEFYGKTNDVCARYLEDDFCSYGVERVKK